MTKIVELLLQSGADPNIGDSQVEHRKVSAVLMLCLKECTPLTHASFMGHAEAAKVLCDNPAVNINFPNKDGMTPLHWVSTYRLYTLQLVTLHDTGSSRMQDGLRGGVDNERCGS